MKFEDKILDGKDEAKGGHLEESALEGRRKSAQKVDEEMAGEVLGIEGAQEDGDVEGGDDDGDVLEAWLPHHFLQPQHHRALHHSEEEYHQIKQRQVLDDDLKQQKVLQVLDRGPWIHRSERLHSNRHRS